MKSHRHLAYCLLLASLWLVGAPLSMGQVSAPTTPANGTTPADQETPGEPEAEQPAEPSGPIPPAEITSQAAELIVRLQQLEETVEPSPTVERLALEFSQQTQALARLRMELTSLTAARVTARRLENKRREWTQLSEQIDRWLATADERWRTLQQEREELRQLQQRWEATREAAAAEELPDEVRQRVDQILARISAVQGELRARIDRVAEFLERLTDARETTSGALRQLAALAERVNQQLLIQDAPPIWRTQAADWWGLDDTSRSAWQAWLYELLQFGTGSWPQLLVQLFVLLVLFAICLYARKASQSWPEEQRELDRARFLVSRPFSISLVLAVLSGVLIHGTLPIVARDFFYLLVLLPLLGLAPGLMHRGERVGLYGLIMLLILFQFAQLCPKDSLLLRVALLALDLVAMGVLVAAVVSVPRREQRGWNWKRVAALGACAVVLLLLLVSLAASLLGWVTLAHFLTEATVLTVQGALLALLLLRAGAGLLPALIHRQPGPLLLSVRQHPELYEKAGLWILGLLLLYQWGAQTLQRFRLRELLTERLEGFLSAPLVWADIKITIGDVVQALLILAGTFLAQRVMSFLLREELFPRLHLRASSTAVFATLLKYTIVAAGLAMAGAALGFSATQLTVLFGALGVGIGFGLQTIVNNFVSGLILMFERPIKIGDVLEANGTWSVVKRIGVRATVLQTFDGAELVVPNGDLISKEVKNWTLSNAQGRLDVYVGTSYKSDPREVIAILHRVAREHELVFIDPKPMVWMLGFGESSLNFRLLCWTSVDNRPEVASQLYVAVFEELAQAGIEIPFPQRDLHLRSVDSEAVLQDHFAQANRG